MKTKNNLLKGIIIGIGVIIVPLILMGTTNTNTGDEVGRYQISTTTMGTGENYIFETIIDTKTGNITSRKKTVGRIIIKQILRVVVNLKNTLIQQ